MSNRPIPRHTFGPRAIAVGRFIAYVDVPGDTADFLRQSTSAGRTFHFRDFWGGYVLAQALAMKTEGAA